MEIPRAYKEELNFENLIVETFLSVFFLISILLVLTIEVFGREFNPIFLDISDSKRKPCLK